MNGFGQRPSGFGSSGGILSMLPPVIKYILLINFGVYFLEHFVMELIYIGGYPMNAYFYKYFALQSISFSFSFLDYSFWPWQLISFQFMHSDFFHIFFNMFLIWMFGVELEKEWGSRKFLFFYLLTGIGSGLVQLAIGNNSTVGASGAVYGIFAAFALLYPNRKLFLFPLFIPVKTKFIILGYVLYSLISGILNTSPDVAHWGHLGGAATGFLLIKFGDQLGIYKFLNTFVSSFGQRGNQSSYSGFGTNYPKSNFSNPFAKPKQETEADRYQVSWTKTDTAEDDYEIEDNYANSKTYEIDGETITQRTIDGILDKISSSGYANLTEREKNILNELSKKL